MPAPDLTPQVPGEQPPATLEPTEDSTDEDLQALTELSVAELTAGLSALTADELQSLAVLEREGKKRKGVLGAIEGELAARAPAPTPEPVADDAIPAQFDRPILTAAGWLVPEPHNKIAKG
jgi:hypothetical protein